MMILLAIIGVLTVCYLLYQKWLYWCVTSTTDILLFRVHGVIQKSPSEYLGKMNPAVRFLIFNIFSISYSHSIHKDIVNKQHLEILMLKCKQTPQWSRFGAKAIYRLWKKYDQASINRTFIFIIEWFEANGEIGLKDKWISHEILMNDLIK